MIKLLLLSILIIGAFSEDCSNFNGEYPCQGDQKAYPEHGMSDPSKLHQEETQHTEKPIKTCIT